MNPILLPQMDELVPGYRYTAHPCGGRISLHPGKHGPHDLRVHGALNGTPSFDWLAHIIIALYKAEERYRLEQDKRGGEYLVANMAAWVHWARTGMGHPMALPSPRHPLGMVIDGEAIR